MINILKRIYALPKVLQIHRLSNGNLALVLSDKFVDSLKMVWQCNLLVDTLLESRRKFISDGSRRTGQQIQRKKGENGAKVQA